MIVITAVCPKCGNEPEESVCELCGYEGEKNGWALQTLYLPNNACSGLVVCPACNMNLDRDGYCPRCGDYH